MKRLMFYLGYALRSLRRDGTRTFLAGLSVAFGVLSLVTMQLLANALLSGAMFDQRFQYGGDAFVQPPADVSGFTADDLTQIQTWQEQGLIAEYTPLSRGSAAFLRTADNGRVTFALNGFGIDPDTYPLVGSLTLREPWGASAADVLQNPGDVLVTRDIAETRALRLGDTIVLSGDGDPTSLTVAGIVDATPTQQGDSVFYSLETARLIEGRDDVVNTIPITWGTAPNAEQTVIDSPYRVYVAANHDGAVENSNGLKLFEIMLQGSGVLGLLVGGVSVSNTLQVMLARRKLEIAMLKTLGYRQADLLMLIGLETGLIGLAGGLVGAALGAQLAGKLLDVLSGLGSLMLDWHPDPVIVGGGVITGLLTAVVFGMQAILATSATRPVQLLREMPLKVPRRTQIGRFGLYAFMLIVFGLLVGVVLGAPLEGILYVVGGGILIVLVRVVFWCVLWAILKLPPPVLPMFRLARANLRHKKMQASLVVLALSAGAFSVSFAALSIYNAQSAVTQRRASDAGYNLMIYATREAAADAINTMILQGAEATYITQQTRGMLNGLSITIEGRNSAALGADMGYDGVWPDDDVNVGLLPDYEANNYAVGDSLAVTIGADLYTLRLIGFYTPGVDGIMPQTGALVVPRQLVEHLEAVPVQTRIFGQFPVDSLDHATTALGLALPEMLVFSRADINDAMTNLYRGLFTFAASVAGLAFVAGAVLIANAAGLNIVERYREIGIFKAVGYTSGHVLRAFLSEYGFLGLLSGLFGIAGTALAVALINLTQPGAELVIEPAILAGMLVFSVGIALLSAIVIAWRPTRVRPLDVLRYE